MYYNLIIKRDNDITGLREFRHFNLIDHTEKLTQEKFLEKIDLLKKDAVNITNTIFIDNGGVAEALLYVYYLLGYETKLFKKDKTTIEKQMLGYAKKIIMFLETNWNDENDKMHQTIELYYCVFKNWNLKDQLNIIDSYYCTFLDTLSIYKYNKQKHLLNGKVKDTLIVLMDSMFDTDFFVSFKLFISNYSTIKISKSVRHHFWKNVDAYNDKSKLMYPLIIELSKLLLNSCSDMDEWTRLFSVLNSDNIANKMRLSSNHELYQIYNVSLDRILKMCPTAHKSQSSSLFNKFVSLFKQITDKTI